MEIQISAGDKEERLALFGETPDGYPAVRDGRESVLTLSKETVAELQEKIQAVRDGEIVPSADESDEVEPE